MTTEITPLAHFEQVTEDYIAAATKYKAAIDRLVEAVGLRASLEVLDEAMQRICNLPRVAPESIILHSRFEDQLQDLLISGKPDETRP